RRVDHAGSHSADQQRVGDPRQHERNAADPALSMNQQLAPLALSPADRAALTSAVCQLENPNFAAKIADYAGAPVNRIMSMLPKAVNRQISGMVRDAVMKGLDVAVDTLEDKPPPSPATKFSSFLA